jgi:hypothetical protein
MEERLIKGTSSEQAVVLLATDAIEFTVVAR